MIRVLEDSSGAVQLVGLSEILVRSVSETLSLLKQSSQLRTSGHTSANANSSRSHAVFQVCSTNNCLRFVKKSSKTIIFKALKHSTVQFIELPRQKQQQLKSKYH